mmetsp:Transcript_17204/g.55049  ORF Transcript_17204/g.55049 Transcript_17204/m.55049 type:complete len:931 (+) Transcript_17204:144-2936(+)
MEPTRLLLAAADLASNGTDLHDLHGDDHGGGHGSHPFTFEELIALIGTLWVIMLFGKIAGRIGLPPLVGEIMSGILVGPHGIDLAPRPTSLMLIGEVGLLLMVLEAGIEVDLSQLALVGGRGVMVAVFGSLVPLLIGFSLAMACFDMEYKNALAVGATLAPTSMGISLKVLQEGGVLNTPTGQLIIAAAVIDDVIALVLLSELEALEDPSIANFIIPIVASLAFILGVGVAAIKFVPGFLAKQVVPRLPAKHVEVVLLGMVLAVGAGLTAGVHYGRSSHLLGAFLGGLCFCTLHSVEEIWRRKVRDIMAWLVRVFFACTIGFEVPIRDLWTAKIVTRAVVFLLAGIGKLATGFFARPLNFRDGATIGWAMSAWGEFAFIVATTARELGSLDEETYGAVILAVLLSTIYSPLMTKTVCNMKPGSGITSMFPVHILRPVLPILPKKIRQMVADEMQRITLQSEMADVPDFQVLNRIGSELNLVGRHSVYYAATVRCRSSWGLTDRLLNSIRESMTIVDFRVSTSGGFTQFLLYLCDKDLLASPDETPEQLEEINRRCAERRRQIRDVLGGSHENVDEKTGHGADNITVLLERWKPVLDDDDTDGTEAFEQADMALRTEERVSATQGRSTGTTTADGKAAMKRMTRAGSMKSIRDMVQSDVDLGLFNAIEKGRVEREKNSVKTRTDIGFGAMQAIQSGRPRARLPFAAATGGIRTRAGGASLDLVGRNSFRMSPDPAGSLYEDWDFLAPKTIKDPEDKKPEGYDDIPAQIPDPDAEKPEDWDDEDDGEWEAPMIDNPDFEGEWEPKMIDNPAYKGIWEARDIPNPDFVDDPSIYHFPTSKFVGFELWQVKSGSIFDSILVTDDVEYAAKFRDETWGATKDAEKAAFDKEEEDRKAKEEEERAKAEEERKKLEEEEGEDEEEEEAAKDDGKDEL